MATIDTLSEVKAVSGTTTTATRRGERPTEPTIFQKHAPGNRAMDLPALDVPEATIDAALSGSGCPTGPSSASSRSSATTRT